MVDSRKYRYMAQSNFFGKMVDFLLELYYIIDNIPATPLNNAQLGGFFSL